MAEQRVTNVDKDQKPPYEPPQIVPLTEIAAAEGGYVISCENGLSAVANGCRVGGSATGFPCETGGAVTG